VARFESIRWPSGGRHFIARRFYLPTVTSAIVFAMIWRWLYDPNFGLLNYALGKLGAPAIHWTGDPKWAMWAVIIAALGAGPGGNVLIYLAALGSIPSDCMESARVDGANTLQRWWFITFPLLRPVHLYFAGANTIGSFRCLNSVFISDIAGTAPPRRARAIYLSIGLAGRYGVARGAVR
jgi:multiple sugar transport system permease protein